MPYGVRMRDTSSTMSLAQNYRLLSKIEVNTTTFKDTVGECPASKGYYRGKLLFKMI